MSATKHEGSNINWIIASILLLLPMFVIVGVIAYCYTYGCTWREVTLGITTYYLANISVGVGAHRLWSHGSYKTTKFVELILLIINSGTLQGPVLAWVSNHKKHHAYADTENDPHTPLKYKGNKLKGFLWSHIGWMCTGEITANNIDKNTMSTLGKSKLLQWQLKYYVQIAVFMNTVAPTLFAYTLFGDVSVQATIAGLFFVGLGRALQQQMTFSVNSVLHMFGSRKYANDSSGDVWWLSFFLLGENWHNFHHAFGRDYRNGHKWYHLDAHKWIIALMAKCGLAWDLVVTSEERIAARMTEMQSNVRSDFQQRLTDIEVFAAKLKVLANEKIVALEKSAVVMADSVVKKAKTKLAQIEASAVHLATNIKLIVEHSEEISAKIVAKQVRKLKALKRAAINAGLDL